METEPEISHSSPIGEVIAVGDELCSGQRLDTNSQWLSRQMGDLGVVVRFHSTVVDEIESMRQVIGTAVARANVVAVSGGLGPTADDLTRDVVAQVAGADLVFDESTLENIRRRYERRGRTMPGNNRRQAWFPEGCQIIPNPRGTAPGIDMPQADVGGRPARLFALPGVPAEMKPMWQEYVAPAIGRMNPEAATIVHRSLQCFGAGESDIEMMLPDLIRRGQSPTVGITASSGTITLRIAARGPSREQCEQQIAPLESLIRQTLGDLVFGDSGQTLQGVVIAQMQDQGRTLAVSDGAVGGVISGWLYQADPAGKVFRGTVGRNGPPGDIDQDLRAAGQWLQADCVLYLGPEQDEPGAGPTRLVMVQINQRQHRQMIPVIRDSTISVEHAAKQALNLLRKLLEKGEL